MARHRKSGRKSGSVSELRDRIHAARQIDPDRTTLLTGSVAKPTDLRQSLRADAALRRSIAASATTRPAGGITRPADARPSRRSIDIGAGTRGAGWPPAGAPSAAAAYNHAADSGAAAVPAALRRRNTLNSMARSTRPATDPLADHLERAYRERRAEWERQEPVVDTPDADSPALAEERRGRHRHRPLAAIRRHSTLTLAGLIPAGLIGIAGATTGTGATALLSAHSDDLTALPQAQDAAAAAPDTSGSAAGATPEASATASPGESTAAGPGESTGGADSYFAAAANVTVPPVEVVSQTTPGSAGGPALRNLPDLPTSLKSSPLGVPPINLATYVRAERITAERDPGCNMSWQLLAGIGRVESSHANDGKVDSDGNLLEPIYGLPLNGSLPGSKVIRDTDGGEYDGDSTYDRAVGPMQFIPQTWKKYATDGTGDGKADPQNLFDAAATTAAYLCDGGLDMRDPAQTTRAIMRYNNSRAYATNVSAWSAAYSTGVAPSPADLPKIH